MISWLCTWKSLQILGVFLSHTWRESKLFMVRSAWFFQPALAWNSLPLCFVTEYDSDTSCHYKVELSYENFITSGPDPHPPPIADDESDDDDDDDIPQVRDLQHPLSSLVPRTGHEEWFWSERTRLELLHFEWCHWVSTVPLQCFSKLYNSNTCWALLPNTDLEVLEKWSIW